MDMSGAVILVPESDHMETAEQRYIAQIIRDYDPYLELQYIPPDKRVAGDKPWAVIHRPPGRPAYFVLYADECDQRILEQLWRADNAKGDPISDMDAKNAAIKAIAYQRYLDESAANADLFAHAMHSPLNTYKYHNPHTGELVTIRN